MSFDGALKGIEKAFGEVRANRGVDLLVRAGTIHALVGENGAGKSTAMKILFGLVKPDAGSIRFGSTVVNETGRAWSPEDSYSHGIGMVHQHFMLAGPETVQDNLVLGAESTRLFGLRDRAKERLQLEELMETTGLRVPLNVTVDSLPIGLQSRCEILKVLYRKARFLILDEPTAVLTPQEIEDFLKTLQILRERGNTILIVTHKLREVMKVADEATVLRAGQTVATRKISETSIEELSELMVGRRVQLPRVGRAEGTERGPIRISLKSASISIDLRAGEITGIAGVEGNGQEALVKALINPRENGPALGLEKLSILNQDALKFASSDLRKLPIGIIPADRHHEGLVLSFSLTENLRLGRAQSGAQGYFKKTSEAELRALNDFDVRPPLPDLEAKALSGGNQQKMIVAREMGSLPKDCVILAVHPTRGVDIGAIEFIHSRLLAAAREGAAVLLVSSELDELMALSHRIAVLYRGAIAGWFEGPPYDEKELGMAMLTGKATK